MEVYLQITANNKVFYNLKPSTFKKVFKVISDNVGKRQDVRTDPEKSVILVVSTLKDINVEKLISAVKEAGITQTIVENPNKENTKLYENAKIRIKEIEKPKKRANLIKKNEKVTNKEKVELIVISVNDSHNREPSSLYFVPVEKLKKKKNLYKLLTTTDEEDFSFLDESSLNKKDLSGVEYAHEQLSNMDVEDKLNDDDFDYKIVSVLKFYSA